MTNPQSIRRTLLLLLAAMLVVRGIAYAAGVGFWDMGLTAWQLLPTHLLRDDLWRSVWYLHSQPPLFNLLTGVLLKIAPSEAAFTILARLLYLGVGILMIVLLFRLLLRLDVPLPLAGVVAGGFAIAPATILFENLYTYDYLSAVLLVVAAYTLHRYASDHAPRDGVLFFAALAGVCLMRSLYHLAWLLVVVALVWWLLPRVRRRTLYVAALPVLLVAAVYGKNLLVFGSFGASSWLGMNVWRIASFGMPRSAREQLVQQGVLSPVAQEPAFRPLAIYASLLPATPPTGIPALDEPGDATHPNLNHLAYRQIAQHYLHDSLTLLRQQPQHYREGLLAAATFYFYPPSDFYFFYYQRNRAALGPYDRFVNRYLLLQRNYHDEQQRGVFHAQLLARTKPRLPTVAVLHDVSLTLLVLLPLLVAYGTVLVGHEWRHAGVTPQVVLLLFILLTIAYTTVLGNLLEVGENNRFRFTIDPLYTLLFALLLRDIAGGVRCKLGRTPPAKPPQ